MTELDETHDPVLDSWVPVAAGSDFPIQNLPFGVCTRLRPTVLVAIGDYALDLDALLEHGLLKGAARDAAQICRGGALHELMAAGRAPARDLRLGLSRLLRRGAAQLERAQACLRPRADLPLALPAKSRGFTDFFTSLNHARNASRIFDPNRPELPNFHSLPIAYHGRSSTLVTSGTPCPRPWGQSRPAGAQTTVFAPSRMLDFELEVGAFVGPDVARGSAVQLAAAESHIFGLCLVNDWSARDIQGWESMPLGPFLGKSFLTTVSPWVVTLDALAPFRCPRAPRAPQAPVLLPYLEHAGDKLRGGFDIELEVTLASERMRASATVAQRLAAPRFRDQYWTFAQMLTHHVSNGCSLESGDLLASGTVSGPHPGEFGCLMELTELGRKPITLAAAEQRGFLEDGDTVMFRGICRHPDYVSIGFGECSGTVVQPARSLDGC